MGEPEITTERLERCLQILRQHEKAKREIICPPAQVYQSPFPDGWAVYINFVNPGDVPVGEVYRTWIVQLRGDEQPTVSYFRSRRGESGDDTLPD